MPAFTPITALELVLRKAAELPYSRSSSIGRDPNVQQTARELIEYIHEATEIARAGGPGLAKGTDALASAVGAVQVAVEFLMTSLSDRDPALATVVSATMAPLLALLPADVLSGSARAARPAPLGQTDNIELCTQAIAAARKHLDAIPTSTGPDARQTLIEFSTPLEAHLFVARDAALAIADRRKRWKLTPAVELLAQKMDELAGILSMDPKLAWHRSFAAAFDAEQALRAAVGTTSLSRPYSGHIDPAAAKKRISELADGKALESGIDGDRSPDTIVNQISAAVTGIFVLQVEAVRQLYNDLRVKDPPRFSIGDALLNIAIDVALTAAGGAIGSLVGMGLKSALKGIVNEARRTVVIDMLKDGAKEMFKSPIKVLRGLPPPASKDHLTAYTNQQALAITTAMTEATMESLGLAPALRQAATEDLAAFLDALNNAKDQAFKVQYANSMREWENLRARIDSPEAPYHFPLGGEADLKKPRVDGVIEIALRYELGKVALTTVKLAGGEPAARTWLRGASLSLGHTQMNERYDVFIPESMYHLEFGVGPLRGLQLETLDDEKMRVLKILAAGDPLTGWNLHMAKDGKYDHISDDRARAFAASIVSLAGAFTTAAMEDKA